MLRRGVNARCVYEEKSAPEVNYRQLIATYDQAIVEAPAVEERLGTLAVVWDQCVVGI